MRKIIDDRGRLFGFISLIDIIVLIVVVVLAAAVLLKFNVSEANPLTTQNTVKVTYNVLILARRQNEVDLMRPGDNLYTDLGTYIGVIKDVSQTDAEFAEWILDGTYVMARVHERFDVTLTVEAECSTSEGRYFVDRIFELNSNSEQKMSTKYNLFTAYITTITTG